MLTSYGVSSQVDMGTSPRHSMEIWVVESVLVQIGLPIDLGLTSRTMLVLLIWEVYSHRPEGILQALTVAIIGEPGSTPSNYNSSMLSLHVVC